MTLAAAYSWYYCLQEVSENKKVKEYFHANRVLAPDYCFVVIIFNCVI